jgi:O-antigen ligase
MSDADATVDAGAVQALTDERRSTTLPGTRVDLVVVGIVVLSLFFERLDRSVYSHGTSAIPDPTFDAAVVLLSLRYACARGSARPGRPTLRECVAAGFAAAVVVVGAASLVALPHWLSSGSQVAKSSIHLAFLVYAAILIGRAVSKELLEVALKLYFWLASAAAALAIVQAVDLNAGSGFLTRNLHLIFRPHPNGYEAPCSIFSEPAQLGYISVAALVVGVLLWPSIGRRRTLAGITLCLLAVLLALSAGAFLVAAVLALVLAVERRPKLGYRTWVGAGALVVVLAAVALASPVGSAVYDRASGIVSGNDPSAQYRTAIDSASFRIWKIAPLTGLGIGNTRTLLPYLFRYQGTYRQQTFNDSNAYLSLLAETGPLGLAAGLLLLAAFIWPATRPVRRPASVGQLNTLGIAVSYFVAGSFLLPPLWFWGGLRLASLRSAGEPDLLAASLASLRRWRFLRPVLLVAVLAAAGAIVYGAAVQRTSSSVLLVTANGVSELSQPGQPGDARLARTDLRIWGRCGRPACHATFHHAGGRIWQIDASWRKTSACFVLDLAAFAPPAERTRDLTRGYSGLTLVPCS